MTSAQTVSRFLTDVQQGRGEAYLKLAAQTSPAWTSKAHFLAAAARAIRHILLDYARDQAAPRLSTATATRGWATAQAWLHRELTSETGTSRP